MIKEKETRRYAEFVDNNLDAVLPGAISLWTEHHNLLLKSFHGTLTPQEIARLNELGHYRIQAEEALLPYLVPEKRSYTIYDIESTIQKNKWMPRLAERRKKSTDDFFAYPFTDQIRSVLLFAMTQIDINKMNQIISTPAPSEYKMDPSKTVRFVRGINLQNR